MIEFNEAIEIAGKKINELVKGAKHVVLEGAVLTPDGGNYEITFSYEVDKGESSNNFAYGGSIPSNVATLAALMGRKRDYKTFIVGGNGNFKGFKIYKGE